MNEAFAPPSTDVTHARAIELLAAAQKKFPDFSLFGNIHLARHTNSDGNRLLNYFSALDTQEKQALSAYVIAQAGDQQTFGQVLRFLRIVNGKTALQVAETVFKKINYRAVICNIEAGDRNFTSKQLGKLFESEAFALSPSDKDKLQALWAKQKHGMSEYKDTEALFAAVHAQLEEYQNGRRPLVGTEEAPGLITRNEVIQALFRLRQSDPVYRDRPEFKSVSYFSLTLFSTQSKNYIGKLLNGLTLLSNAYLKPITAALGIAADSDRYKIIEKLPFYAAANELWPKQFDESVRAEMVKPEVARVFRHPGLYDSLGGWLNALRNAAQMNRDQVTVSIFNQRCNTIVRLESNKTSLSFDELNALLDTNWYSLPTDAGDKVSEGARHQFKLLASSGITRWQHTLSHLGLDKTTSRWYDLKMHLSKEMKRSPSARAWQAYFKEQIKPELDEIDNGNRRGAEERFSIIIEGRPLHVIRQGDEVMFPDEDIRRLAHDKHFIRRLELQLAGLEKETAGPAVG